jgi:hypothetical protein
MAATAIALVPDLLPPDVALPTLYALEEHLEMLLDTEEMVPPEFEAEFRAELQRSLLATVAKRDRVGQFMAHLEGQITLAHLEIKRLQERETFFVNAYARVESYVMETIESLGLDDKGKRKKLEGNTVTLSLHGCDRRAEIVDEQAVAMKYKRATVTLPAETWDLVCDSLDLDLREQVMCDMKSPKLEVSLALVKTDLKAGIDVTGAKLAGGTYLVRK